MPITTITPRKTRLFGKVSGAVGQGAKSIAKTVESDLVSSPILDCYVLVPQELSARITPKMSKGVKKTISDVVAKENPQIKPPIIKTELPKIKNQDDLRKHLKGLKEKNGNARLTSDDIREIVSLADTPEKAQLAVKLAQLEDKNGNARLDNYDIIRIVSSVDTPEKAQFKFDLTDKLAQLEDENGNARLYNYSIREIVSSVDTPEKAQFKAEYAYNKEFLTKIDKLDSSIGNKLYAETLESGVVIDVERMNRLYNYLCENKINLQQHGEERITNQSIVNLFDSSMLKVSDLLDDGVIKYATKLKYSRFQEFIDNSSSLANDLDKDTYTKLQANLSKLSTPGLKFERLQSIIALKNADSQSHMINEAINLIKSPRTTIAQINLANEIFTSNKSYQEQIQEFFEKFNVQENQRAILKSELEAAHFDTPWALEESTDVKVKGIDKKIAELRQIIPDSQRLDDIVKLQNRIQRVQNDKTVSDADKVSHISKIEAKIKRLNTKQALPEDKRKLCIEQLENQRKILIIKVKNEDKIKLNPKALNLLAQIIERYINIPKNNIEFNHFLNSQIYKRLNIKPTPELLKILNFDKQYLPNLFSALSDSDFSDQFTKLIKLIKENPSKPLSELRETLEHNGQTKKLFEQNGINYQKWIKFDKNSNLPFSCETDLQKAIRGVELNIVNELNGDLFKSVNPTETDKILKALADAGYKLDSESITKNGQEITQKDLEKIVDIFKTTINKNIEFWDKPLADSNAESLKNELIDHLLKGRKKEVADLATMANVKMDLAVRLSDDDDISRNLFLGNHVGCCTAVDGSYSFAAPQHLMNSFVRAIEIVDKGGNSYGNSMCYFAKVDNKLSFIVDSFEANGKLGGNQAVTDAIVDYAKQVTREMGNPNVPIYFGPNYNKINMSKLQKTPNHTIEIIGRVEDGTYIDAIGGKRDVNTSHPGRVLYNTF